MQKYRHILKPVLTFFNLKKNKNQLISACKLIFNYVAKKLRLK